MGKQFRTPEEEKALEAKAAQYMLEVADKLRASGIKLRGESDGVVNLVRIGHWLWCDGLKDEAKARGILKGMGFKFSRTRLAFGWSPYTYRGKRSKLELPQLAQKYGYQVAPAR